MPAVTVDDLTTLPRMHAPGLGDTVRPVLSVTTAPRGFEGEGFPVRRAFAGVDLRLLDPFVHMDQMGEVEYAPGEPKGTPWHPHRGFETVTYMIDGVMDHQDSHGGGGSITNGDTQWMTAGSGLLHIETPPEWLVAAGGLFHGVQLWVNLPREQKWADAALPGPPLQPARPGHHGRRGCAGAGHRRRRRRARRPRVDAHADGDGARAPWRRARGSTSRGRSTSTRWSTCWPARAPSGLERRPIRGRPARRARPRRLRDAGRRRPAGQPHPDHGGAGARWPADPGAGGLGRAVRDEHQGRGACRPSRTSRRAGWGRSPRCMG